MTKAVKVKVICLECNTKFQVGATKVDVYCPKCGGVDIEVR